MRERLRVNIKVERGSTFFLFLFVSVWKTTASVWRRKNYFPDPGVWYLFKVSTETKVGWSPERSLWVQIPPGPPSGPPLEVRASAHSSTRVRVTWKEPDEWKRNGPLAGYSVVYNPLYRRVKALVKNVTNPNHTRTMLTNLKMFTDYEIRVRALGVKGPGPLSPSVVIKTKEGCKYEINGGVWVNWPPTPPLSQL